MPDLIDEAYEKLTAAHRAWMLKHGATANGDDIRASGPVIFRQVIGPYLQSLADIDKLRADEGDSVTIYSDNAGFNDLPNCAIGCCGDWTEWFERRFDGNTVAAALHAAVIDRRGCIRPLGCDCPACIKALGPIAPGNVGKELRANPTGEFQNPRG